jgi:hypothetical protein
MLIGWMQFSKKIRARNPELHRGLGKAYMAAVAFRAVGGYIIAMSATGGAVSMGGYRAIRRLDIAFRFHPGLPGDLVVVLGTEFACGGGVDSAGAKKPGRSFG